MRAANILVSRMGKKRGRGAKNVKKKAEGPRKYLAFKISANGNGGRYVASIHNARKDGEGFAVDNGALKTIRPSKNGFPIETILDAIKKGLRDMNPKAMRKVRRMLEEMLHPPIEGTAILRRIKANRVEIILRQARTTVGAL